MGYPNLGHRGRGRPETQRAAARRAAQRRKAARPPARLRRCRTCGEPFAQPYRPGPACVDCPACRPVRDRAWPSRAAACACGRPRSKGARLCRGCHVLACRRVWRCRCGATAPPGLRTCSACALARACARESKPARLRLQRRRSSAARAARLRAVGSKAQVGRWRRICERDGWACWICGGEIDPALVVPNRLAGTADHVIALRNGGDDTDANLRAAHFTCNIRRGARRIDRLADPTRGTVAA
jgi:HNH endonuclease